MVGKLLKYELLYIIRNSVAPTVALLCFTVLSKIAMISINGSEESVVMPIALIFYSLSLIYCVIWFFYAGISRIYSSLFTREGYMTLSLPASTDQLIISKLLATIIAAYVGIFICFLSAVVVFLDYSLIGQYIRDGLEFFAYMTGSLQKGGEVSIYELLLLAILRVPQGYLIIFLAMAIGQLSTVRNRKVVTCAILICALFVWGIISSYVTNMLEDYIIRIQARLYIWLNIIFVLAVNVACYFLIRYILKHKINLIA